MTVGPHMGGKEVEIVSWTVVCRQHRANLRLSLIGMSLFYKLCTSDMRIFGAVGLAITIIVLQWLMPRVFAGLEQTLVQFFHLAQVSLTHAETIIEFGQF